MIAFEYSQYDLIFDIWYQMVKAGISKSISEETVGRVF